MAETAHRPVLVDGAFFLKAARGLGPISPEARQLLNDPQTPCYVSVISIWQLLMRVKAGLETLPEPALPMLQYERSILGLQALPLDEACLVRLCELDDLSFNAFDQVLICQAMHHGMRFLTDRSIFSNLELPVVLS